MNISRFRFNPDFMTEHPEIDFPADGATVADLMRISRQTGIGPSELKKFYTTDSALESIADVAQMLFPKFRSDVPEVRYTAARVSAMLADKCVQLPSGVTPEQVADRMNEYLCVVQDILADDDSEAAVDMPGADCSAAVPGRPLSYTGTLLSDVLLRHGVTMRAVSERFGIPYRTLQHWKAGDQGAPEYVIRMMDALLQK